MGVPCLVLGPGLEVPPVLKDLCRKGAAQRLRALVPLEGLAEPRGRQAEAEPVDLAKRQDDLKKRRRELWLPRLVRKLLRLRIPKVTVSHLPKIDTRLGHTPLRSQLKPLRSFPEVLRRAKATDERLKTSPCLTPQYPSKQKSKTQASPDST